MKTVQNPTILAFDKIGSNYVKNAMKTVQKICKKIEK